MLPFKDQDRALDRSLFRKLSAEAIGTFLLVFVGTGAMVINDVTGGGVTHVGIAIAFGLIVTAMIYSIGDVSGAHINPAVTAGFFLAGRFPGNMVLPYAAAQCSGAVFASLTLSRLFPLNESLGMTLPAFGVGQSFVLEILLTFTLMFVILGVSTGAREKGITAGLAVGGTVAMAAVFAGPISGASMNPARSLGPAVAAGQLEHLWIYFTATLVGAALAVPACRCVHNRGCCKSPLLPS